MAQIALVTQAFEQAALEARQARLPALELIATAELQRCVLVPQGRGAEGQRRLEQLAQEKLQGRGLEELRDLFEVNAGGDSDY